MRIKKFMTPEMYVERVEGSEEWYLGVAFEEDVCDLFDAEIMEKEGKNFWVIALIFFIILTEQCTIPSPQRSMSIMKIRFGTRIVLGFWR